MDKNVNDAEDEEDKLTNLLQNVTLQTDKTLENGDKSVKKKNDIPSSNFEKHAIRTKIWDLMEAKNFVKDYPRSCHDKFPNFRRCGTAAEKVGMMREFRMASVIKINPSLAQMHLRYLTLKHRKTLLVPSPSLEDSFMYKIDPKTLTELWQLKRASSKAGAKELGVPVNFADGGFKIDLFVVASVACSKNGVRLGKGMGYAEIEWGVFWEMGVVDQSTLVLTTCHEAQLVYMPVSMMASHDLPVDIIVTPCRIINVRRRLTKPSCGIQWDKLSEKHLNEITVLKDIKACQLGKSPPNDI